MTAHEERLLRCYHGYGPADPRFDEWLDECRDGTPEGAAEYKSILDQARAWERGLAEGRRQVLPKGQQRGLNVILLEDNEDAVLALSKRWRRSVHSTINRIVGEWRAAQEEQP